MATQPIEAQTVPEAVIGAEIEAETQTPARDFEAEARLEGWRPPEEWPEGKPRPREFKDAETFIREGEEKAGLQKKTISHLTEKLRFLERQVKHLTRSEQNAYANALADLEARQDAAVEVGDVAEAKRLRTEAKKLTEANADPLKGENPVEELATFREDNPWFDKANLASASETEVEARLFADRLADKWIGQGLPNEIPPSEFYRRLADAVKEKYPGLGRKAAPAKPASDVAGVTTRAAPRGAKTGANLPPEAKAHAERYMRQKIPGFGACKTKQEAYDLFAQSYEWE